MGDIEFAAFVAGHPTRLHQSFLHSNRCRLLSCGIGVLLLLPGWTSEESGFRSHPFLSFMGMLCLLPALAIFYALYQEATATLDHSDQDGTLVPAELC
jgi:hypothetical protein